MSDEDTGNNIAKIQAAVASEAARCGKEKDRHYVILRSYSKAIAIQTQARGDTRTANDLAEGASAFLMDEVVRFNPMAQLLGQFSRRASQGDGK